MDPFVVTCLPNRVTRLVAFAVFCWAMNLFSDCAICWVSCNWLNWASCAISCELSTGFRGSWFLSCAINKFMNWSCPSVCFGAAATAV